MINPNLAIGLSYLAVGLALLIGGIIVPSIYTVAPLAMANGGCPMNLVWRLVVKFLFVLLIMEKAILHLYAGTFFTMPPRIYYEPFDYIVIAGLAIALIATWITHPDHLKSV